MALILAVALAPAGFSVQGLIENDAMANATYRPGLMAPHSKREYTSGGELRVCNDGPVAVRLYINDSDSLLVPGQCNQSWGHIMTVVNESNVPANVWAYGSLGGRIGTAGGHK
jgi:hypothetical protein